MAPIRRYLRITEYAVLEVRIYLDNPALADSWLLNSRDPVLPRVIEAIRPLVIPKLREENENAKRKGGKKKKGVKDVVSKDDFEVSVFLTETSTKHALLTKAKSFADKPRLKSNSNKLAPYLNTSDNPINVDESEVPSILHEEEETEEIGLQDIPEAGSGHKRGHADDDAISVGSDDEQPEFQTQRAPRAKRKKVADVVPEEAPGDDKKKMGLTTAYDGFNIYGRVLCLIVKRKGVKKTTATGLTGGSQMLENWVSTQAAQDAMGGMEDD